LVQVTTDISVGNLLTIATVAAAAFRYHRDWVDLVHEHRIMWTDFCRRHGIVDTPERDINPGR
jgi:hypothetical protein